MHRLKGQDVPLGGRLAGEQPDRSRGAVVSRVWRSAQITRRPLPPLGADFFARATSRERTSKLSMIDGVEAATKVSTKATTERTDPPPTVLNSNVAIFGAGVRSCTEKRLSLGQPLIPS